MTLWRCLMIYQLFTVIFEKLSFSPLLPQHNDTSIFVSACVWGVRGRNCNTLTHTNTVVYPPVSDRQVHMVCDIWNMIGHFRWHHSQHVCWYLLIFVDFLKWAGFQEQENECGSYIFPVCHKSTLVIALLQPSIINGSIQARCLWAELLGSVIHSDRLLWR